MSMDFRRRLPMPIEVKEELPLSRRMAVAKAARDWAVGRVLKGEDGRKLLIVGPCSADREDAIVEYCVRLARLQEKVSDQLIIIPRIYTNKPRTTGEGYKGMFHQPDPHGGSDMLEGIKAIRRLNLRVVSETGLFAADEMLYPASYRFLSDLLSYVAVGARSVENQEHRLTASGLDIPVGMKNPTGGSVDVLLNSVNAAQRSHMFVYRNWEVVTTGNPLAHVILRGYTELDGSGKSNYGFDDLVNLCEKYGRRDLVNRSFIVDCNHSNSGKRFEEQPRIVREVLDSCSRSEAVSSMFKGFMIESYLLDGSQKVGGGVYGRSITDPCLGWEKTEHLVLELAGRLS